MTPTQKLITTGPYRCCRNPMMLGRILAYLGLGIAAGMVTGVAVVLLLGGLLVACVKWTMQRRLGDLSARSAVRHPTVPAAALRIAPTQVRGFSVLGGG